MGYILYHLILTRKKRHPPISPVKFILSPYYLLSSRRGLAYKVTLITKDWTDLQKLPKFRASVNPKDIIIISPVHRFIFGFDKEGYLVVIPVVPVVLLLFRSSTFAFWVLTCINTPFIFLTLPGVRKVIHAQKKVEQEILFPKGFRNVLPHSILGQLKANIL